MVGRVLPRFARARQQELLDLAGRQGLLYAHQVGSTAAPPSRRPTPASLLNGAAADLETFNAPPLAEPDTGLDAAQRDAVARAMHTPDICLIQGAAGTGKSRVVAEIVVRAAARGERVLLLAASPAALDCVLERVGANEALCPVRCVGVDERPEALPACVRRVIFAERLRFFEEKTVGAARQALDAARQQCAALRHCTAIWPRLESALHQLERIDADGKSLAECRVGLPAEVAAATEQMAGSDATPFGAALRDLAARGRPPLPTSTVARPPAARTPRSFAALRTDSKWSTGRCYPSPPPSGPAAGGRSRGGGRHSAAAFSAGWNSWRGNSPSYGRPRRASPSKPTTSRPNGLGPTVNSGSSAKSWLARRSPGASATWRAARPT